MAAARKPRISKVKPKGYYKGKKGKSPRKGAGHYKAGFDDGWNTTSIHNIAYCRGYGDALSTIKRRRAAAARRKKK